MDWFTPYFTGAQHAGNLVIYVLVGLAVFYAACRLAAVAWHKTKKEFMINTSEGGPDGR